MASLLCGLAQGQELLIAARFVQGIGGAMTSAGGSVGHWIFFVNIPIGVATAARALRMLPRDSGIGLGRAADVLGALLV